MSKHEQKREIECMSVQESEREYVCVHEGWERKSEWVCEREKDGDIMWERVRESEREWKTER